MQAFLSNGDLLVYAAFFCADGTADPFLPLRFGKVNHRLLTRAPMDAEGKDPRETARETRERRVDEEPMEPGEVPTAPAPEADANPERRRGRRRWKVRAT